MSQNTTNLLPSKSEEKAPKQPIKSENPENLPSPSPNSEPVRQTESQRQPSVSDYGRSDIDPSNNGGMIFDPFRDQYKNKYVPGNLPPGYVPPEARFDPYGPPNPDDLKPGSSPVGPNPSHLRPPDFEDQSK